MNIDKKCSCDKKKLEKNLTLRKLWKIFYNMDRGKDKTLKVDSKLKGV